MTDKERILLCLVQTIFCRSLYDSENSTKWRESQPEIMGTGNPLQPGDLVVASSTFTPNEFMVGFVYRVLPDCVVIREIGGNRLCNYYNERFFRIEKEILGYEILEGTEYITYNKVLKAFAQSDNSYQIRFKEISFKDKTCVVAARKVFSNEKLFEISFKYSKRTTIKEITEKLNDAALKLKSGSASGDNAEHK